MSIVKRLLSTVFFIVLLLAVIGLAVLGLSTLADAFRSAPWPMTGVLGAFLLMCISLVAWHFSNPDPQ